MMTPAQRAVIMVACMALPLAPAVAAGETSITPVTHSLPFTDADFVLLQTDADGIALTDALGGYSSRAGLYLPVGELARLLDLAIYVDPAKQTASGWIVIETRAFDLDLQRRFAKVEGRELKLQPADVVFMDGEMYIRAELAQRLLPFSVVADLGELTLHIRSREELPFKARLNRLSRANSIRGGMVGNDANPHAVLLDQPYRFISPPSFDLTLTGELGNRGPRTGGSYDLRLGGDLLYAGFQLFAASDHGDRTCTRCRLCGGGKSCSSQAEGGQGANPIFDHLKFSRSFLSWCISCLSGVLSLEHRAPLDSGSRAFSSTPIWVACWRGYRSVAAGPCHHWIVSLARPQVPVTS